MKKLLLLFILLLIPFAFAQSVDCRQSAIPLLQDIMQCKNISINGNSVHGCDTYLDDAPSFLQDICGLEWLQDQTLSKTSEPIQCRFTITEQNFPFPQFNLQSNYTCTSTNFGFRILKSNFIFNCNNHYITTLDGVTPNAIEVFNAQNVTISNCLIYNLSNAGMFFSGTSQNIVVNNTIYENNIGMTFGGGGV